MSRVGNSVETEGRSVTARDGSERVCEMTSYWARVSFAGGGGSDENAPELYSDDSYPTL